MERLCEVGITARKERERGGEKEREHTVTKRDDLERIRIRADEGGG